MHSVATLFIQNYDVGTRAYDIEAFGNDILCFFTPERIVTYDGQQQHVHKVPITLIAFTTTLKGVVFGQVAKITATDKTLFM